MGVLAATTQASSSTQTHIRPAFIIFVKSRLDPLTDTLVKLERQHEAPRPTLTLHEQDLRNEYGRWATGDLVNEAHTAISGLLHWRAVADDFYMAQREKHLRASDPSSGNGQHTNGNGAHSNSSSNGNGSKANGHDGDGTVEFKVEPYSFVFDEHYNGTNGNGKKDFMEDSIRRDERRTKPLPTQQLVSEYAEKIYAILHTLELRGEFDARDRLLATQGLRDSLILTRLEDRACWP